MISEREADLRSEYESELMLESCQHCGNHPEIDGGCAEMCPSWEDE